MNKPHTKTMKTHSSTSDKSKNSPRIEQIINTICLNGVKNVFTCGGKEPDGVKLFQHILQNPNLIITEPLPTQYTEVTCDSLCSYLLEHFSDKYKTIKVDLTDNFSRQCVYSLFYIWIYNHQLLGKLDIQSSNDNSLIVLSLRCFTRFKTEILDGHTMEILPEDNGGTQKGGNIRITLTIYLFLLLIVFTPYAVSPENSDVFEKVKSHQPEKQFRENVKQAAANQLNKVVNVGEIHFNDEVKSFLRIVDFAGMAPYELLVKKDTVNLLHQYYDYGGNHVSNKMGFTLKQSFNFLLKLKTKVNQLHNHLFKIKFIQLYKDANENVKKRIGYIGAAALGAQDNKKMESDIGYVSIGFLKSFLRKTIRTMLPGIVGPLYTFDNVLLGIDDINDELNKNESSLNTGVTILHAIEKLKELKNMGTEKLKAIVQGIEPKKKSLHKFDLSKEDFETPLLASGGEISPSDIPNADILLDLVDEGTLLGGRRRKSRKLRKSKK